MPEAHVSVNSPKTPQLSGVELARVTILHGLGLSQRAIAAELQRNRDAIRLALQQPDVQGLVELGRRTFHQAIPELTVGALKGCQVAAEKGHPEHAIEVLTRLEVLPPPAPAGGPQVAILVGGSAPGLPSVAVASSLPAAASLDTRVLSPLPALPSSETTPEIGVKEPESYNVRSVNQKHREKAKEKRKSGLCRTSQRAPVRRAAPPVGAHAVALAATPAQLSRQLKRSRCFAPVPAQKE